jgi:hypothetical protein
VQEVSMNKVARMLEMFGGHVHLHVGERDDDVVCQFQREFGKLPNSAEVLNVMDPDSDGGYRYIPTYEFRVGQPPTEVHINIYGKAYPTQSIAEQRVNFWKAAKQQEEAVTE